MEVELLKSIPGVGDITALTWALEIGEVSRFGSIRQAISYCGLCPALDSSAGKTKRGPLSKQRNKFLQSILIEAAKLAPMKNPQLRDVRTRAIERGANHNEATIDVARKLVAYLLAVDKRGEPFQLRCFVNK
jgi:transposase